MISLSKRRELFFFHQPECGACAIAKPVMDSWASRHYGDVMVASLDLSMYDGKKYGFMPKATPAYLYVEDGEAVRDHTGILRAKELDEFTKASE